MKDEEEMSYDETQETESIIRRETYPDILNVTYTSDFVSSQAFVQQYASEELISKLIKAKA